MTRLLFFLETPLGQIIQFEIETPYVGLDKDHIVKQLSNDVHTREMAALADARLTLLNFAASIRGE